MNGRLKARTFFGLRLWLKIEVAVPYALVEGASATADVDIALGAALLLACLGTFVEDWLLSKPAIPFHRLIVLVISTSLLPVTVYGILLFRLKQLGHFGNPLATYGLGETLCFLCGFIIVGRSLTQLIEMWLDKMSTRASKPLNK